MSNDGFFSPCTCILAESRASYHETMKYEKNQFNDSMDKDLDWKVKSCYLLLLAAATEKLRMELKILGSVQGWKSMFIS
jgi:hypothetical protein